MSTRISNNVFKLNEVPASKLGPTRQQIEQIEQRIKEKRASSVPDEIKKIPMVIKSIFDWLEEYPVVCPESMEGIMILQDCPKFGYETHECDDHCQNRFMSCTKEEFLNDPEQVYNDLPDFVLEQLSEKFHKLRDIMEKNKLEKVYQALYEIALDIVSKLPDTKTHIRAYIDVNTKDCRNGGSNGDDSSDENEMPSITLQEYSEIYQQIVMELPLRVKANLVEHLGELLTRTKNDIQNLKQMKIAQETEQSKLETSISDITGSLFAKQVDLSCLAQMLSHCRQEIEKTGDELNEKEVLLDSLMKLFNHRKGWNMGQDETVVSKICTICQYRPITHALECGHIFCRNCLDAMIAPRYDNNVACPKCRVTTHSHRFLRIYL